MQEIKAKILGQRIIHSDVYISQKISAKFGLGIKCQIEMKTPKDQDEKSVLLKIKMNIDSEDEKVKIELLSDVIFELNELPDDYNNIAESILVPMARDSLLNSLDDILVVMGYNKMGLAKKMQ